MSPEPNVRLADWCTLGVGGPARWFWRAGAEASLQAALAWAQAQGLAVHVLGGGSNIVVADDGFDGLVVFVDIRGVTVDDRDPARVTVRAGAGEPWDPLVAATVVRGLAGLECLSGIPGQVGGTPIQNVGAYGQDVSATIGRVDCIDRVTHQTLALSNADCGFGYRSSRFKRDDRDRFIVTHVEFVLAPGAPALRYADVVDHFARAGETAPTLSQVREAILAIRRAKGMVIEPGNPAARSVGSFFVNPVITLRHFERLSARHTDLPNYLVGADAVKVPAAWLIEHAGFSKGTRRGSVGISPLQAQAIVNHGAARAQDVVDLAASVKAAVRETFGVALVPEPIFVGFRPSAALRGLFDPASRLE
jgi:UDP-N-acetylmuramate dehydrogenase